MTTTQYILIAHPISPDGTSGAPVDDRTVADQIGAAAGLGPTPDPAGFAIWPVGLSDTPMV